MQQTQVVTYGVEGIIAERLRELAEKQRFWLRETSQYQACRGLLQASPPSVLILRLGRDVERELSLLEETHACLPETATIVLGEADNPVLAGLAWQLGATFVLFPPTPAELILEVIPNMLTTS